MKLVINAFLISFYVVQVIAVEHYPCKAKNGHDITKRFEISFILGLIVLVADLVNSTVLATYF